MEPIEITGETPGLAVGALCRSSRLSRGMTVALINSTNRLQGVQLGLVNHAGNNPRGLKVLPILNVHLGR